MLFNSTSRPSEPPPSKSPSPPASPKKSPLNVASVAHIFLKMRDSQQRVKSHHIVSSSGGVQTHPGTALSVRSSKRGPLQVTDNYLCIGGVNVNTLLRATRGVLLEHAESFGANALVDEEWKCTICGPKHRSNGTFRVQIHYSASAIRSSCPDAHRPVALDQAKSVPGLMMILKRNDD